MIKFLLLFWVFSLGYVTADNIDIYNYEKRYSRANALKIICLRWAFAPVVLGVVLYNDIKDYWIKRKK